MASKEIFEELEQLWNTFTENHNRFSEKQVKALDGSDPLQLAEAVSFLILKREWQKVWFRNKY